MSVKWARDSQVGELPGKSKEAEVLNSNQEGFG